MEAQNQTKSHSLKKTFDELLAAQDKGPVHDVDIKRWAVEAGIKVQCEGFKASRTFIDNFKKEFNIVSRKITKIVSRANFRNEDGLREKAASFVQSVRPMIDEFGPENVFNTDQSGFNLEMSSGSCLHFF